MSKFGNYEEYLLSDKWERIKSDFMDNSDYAKDVCFFCMSRDGLQCHHWRYPKDWDNDSYKNLILLCSCCHSTAHKIEHDKMLHNSYMFEDNSTYNLVRYLSYIIKATRAMEIFYFEILADEF